MLFLAPVFLFPSGRNAPLALVVVCLCANSSRYTVDPQQSGIGIQLEQGTSPQGKLVLFVFLSWSYR